MKINNQIFKSLGAFLAFFIFLGLPVSTFAAQELWTRGRVQFDPNLTSGAATYSYPIDLPEGRKGIQPNIAPQEQR